MDEFFNHEFIRVPRPLIKLFGTDGALLMSELYAEYRFWRLQAKLEKDGSFFSTVENIESSTGLSKKIQLKEIKKLVDYGIITVKVKGMPRKRYFKINCDVIGKMTKDLMKMPGGKSPNVNNISVVCGVQNIDPKYVFWLKSLDPLGTI